MINKIDDTFLEYACDWFGDTKNGLTGTEIIKFCIAYSVKYGIYLAYNSMHLSVTGGKNKRTVLFENIRNFEGKQQFEMLIELCKHKKFQNEPKTTEIHTMLIQRFSFLAPDPSELMDKQIITETKELLDEYPIVKKHYDSALIQFQNHIFDQNLVDNLRFSFEQLLKVIFENDKPLEKQQNELTQFLKKNNVSEGLNAMYNKLREYYCNFQNTQVKHNDKINCSELEFLIELTSIMMKLLIRINND